MQWDLQLTAVLQGTRISWVSVEQLHKAPGVSVLHLVLLPGQIERLLCAYSLPAASLPFRGSLFVELALCHVIRLKTSPDVGKHLLFEYGDPWRLSLTFLKCKHLADSWFLPYGLIIACSLARCGILSAFYMLVAAFLCQQNSSLAGSYSKQKEQ